ncbi:zinc-binding alcohol dehydrogenase [bacterium]|nr:zinc-binding alcohol dehydrogenase [bacterium]
MKELIAIEPGKAILRDYEERELKPNEVRVKSEVSAEKHGTHLSFFLGRVPNVDKDWNSELELFIPREGKSSLFPFHLGNITVGRIVEVGKDVKEFKIGDRVWGYLPIRETHTVDISRISLIPEGLTDEEVLCIDPATVALMSVREGRFSLGDRVAVFGLGAIGLLTVQMARLNGATFIVAIDPIEERRNLAKVFGADLILGTDIDVGLEIKLATGKRGVDVSIETSGSYRALHQAIRGTRYGGTIVTTSLYHGEGIGLDLGEEWHINRHTMVSGIRVESEPYRDFPRWDRKRIYDTVIELFKKKLLSIDGFLHTVPFGDVLSAYETLKTNPNKWIKLGVRY